MKKDLFLLIDRAMRITIFLTLACVVNVCAKSYSQERLTLSLKEVKLSRVFHVIQHQTHYQFIYNNEDIQGAPLVSVMVKGATVPQILALCFTDNYPLEYRIEDSTVIVLRRPLVPRTMKLPAEIAIPQFTVHGKVTDSLGNPLVGVSVSLKGSSTGTVTDANGDYSLTLESGEGTLVFSYVGYENKEVGINGRSTINVALSAITTGLNQLVVVGYGTQKKISLTGAIATVDASELRTMPDANLASRLQGRVSGVTVVNDNSPGGTPSIRIRGYGSINNNNPLYVVDGVPISGGLDNINPYDIKSISILKDASSSAIYGSRASNGVVLITTKHGKPGEPKLTISARYGFQNFKNEIEKLSPMEAAEVSWLGFKNDGLKVGDVQWGSPMYGYGPTPVLPDYVLPIGKMEGDPEVDPSLYRWPRPYYGIIKANKAGTDWFKVINNANAPIQEYNLGLSGGTDKGDYAFSAGYMDQQGTVLYTDYKRYSLRLNADVKIGNWLTVGENLGASYDNRVGFGNQNDLNPIAMAARMGEINPVYDIKGHFAGGYNPLWLLYTNKDNYTKNIRVLGNGYAQVEFLKDFTLKTLFGIDYTTSRGQIRTLIQYQSNDAAASDRLTQNYSGDIQYNWANTLNYHKTIRSDHDINLLLGSEVVNNYSDWLSGGRGSYPFTNTDYMVLDAGEADQTSGGSYDRWFTFSYFGRLNYNYKEKYLFEAVVRRDGSSRFTDARRWGTFPAISLGWRISEESFMNSVKWIDNLKLRAGFGKNGNDNVGNYNTYSTYRSNIGESYYNITGANSTSSEAGFHKYKLGNPDARWESTTTTDIGLDMTFFKNKLEVGFDMYRRKTTDMLYPASKPATFGQVVLPSINIGDMLNKGFDLTLTYHGRIGKEFTFNLSGNASHYKNEILKLNDNPDEILYGNELRQDVFTASKAGHPVSSFYGYVVEGIFNTQKEVDDHAKYNPNQNGEDSYSRPGVLMFKDVNGDGKITSDDRTFTGSPHPDLTYGLNINLNYRNWDLNIFSQGVIGNKILNFRFWSGFSGVGEKRILYESWTAERYKNGDKITVPMVTRDETIMHLPSSFFLENGSYFRTKSLELGYTLPSKIISKLRIDGGLRIYIQATNLLTITKYSGFDPEIRPSGDLTLGVDNSVYPTPLTLIFGLNMNF